MFSLIEHITSSPKIVVCGYPSSGKNTFISNILSKHVGDQRSDDTTIRGYKFVNYKGGFSFYIKEENNLDTVMKISSSDDTEGYRHTYFVLFVNASLIHQSEPLNESLRQWLKSILLEDRRYMRLHDSKSNSLFIAVSHLDNPDAASMDDIDEKLNSQSFRKLLCNFGFPNYEKQVDVFIQELGTTIGAKNNPLKEVWRNTEKVRNVLAESARTTTSWIAHQSNELAGTIQEQFSGDESSLAAIALIGLNPNDRDAVFSVLSRNVFSSQENEITMQVIRDFAGYTFRLCNISPQITTSNQTRKLVETCNGIIFVVSENIPLNDQKTYFEECLKNVENTIPVLYVSVGFELDNDEWMKLEEGRFVCTVVYISGVIPAFCNFITEKQKIKTSHSKMLANILPKLEEKFNTSLDWTVEHQQKLSHQLHNTFDVVSSSVKESVKEYTPHIQEKLGTVSETVSESVKNVSTAVSSYWNSLWSGDNE